jgi:hypothetical protein
MNIILIVLSVVSIIWGLLLLQGAIKIYNFHWGITLTAILYISGGVITITLYLWWVLLIPIILSFLIRKLAGDPAKPTEVSLKTDYLGKVGELPKRKPTDLEEFINLVQADHGEVLGKKAVKIAENFYNNWDSIENAIKNKKISILIDNLMLKKFLPENHKLSNPRLLYDTINQEIEKGSTSYGMVLFFSHYVAGSVGIKNQLTTYDMFYPTLPSSFINKANLL